MRVSALHLYPVKSCRGIAVDRWPVGRRGLEHDRRWMIVDDAGVFLTQRETPSLARVDTRLEADELVLSAEGHGMVRIPTAPATDPRRRVRVWSSEVDAVDCGEGVARWLSAWVGSAVRLVHMPDDVRRAVDPDYALPGDIVGFADGFPLLLATTASLDDLNTRLDVPVPMDRFRPNVVVTGCAAWEEDEWTRIVVGDVPCRVAKPCGRCTIITTDQRTGDRGPEPLRTLATFRQQEHKVNFAQNCVPDETGTLAIGDEVRVLARRPGHANRS
jgi:uncharacterized protein YcbX